jgi:hypothetical protein
MGTIHTIEWTNRVDIRQLPHSLGLRQSIEENLQRTA